MGFVGNYALRGLSPQTDGMPVEHQKRLPQSRQTHFLPAALHYLFAENEAAAMARYQKLVKFVDFYAPEEA